MNEQDQTLEETPDEVEETSEETAPKEQEAPEEIDYSAKFKASQAEAIRLKKELDELKSAPKEEIPDDEKRIRDILAKTEAERQAQAKKEDERLKRELDELHSIHGEFDNDKLLKIADRYGVYDSDGNVQWEKAMELYERLEGVAEPPKKKSPSSNRTGDKPKAEPYDSKGKTLDDIVEEAKQEIPN
jgi:hypothetical protein